ncbi:GIY-YIG nuclease family protein [Oceanimonas smirnovii]|uniref:GIY-YIG nuclease family protein n=1 Tax=Oceanimonas smirnovii TaxID=264574 RepID=A0ABW7P3L4_9GAMM
MNIQKRRDSALKELTDETGVYALCDLDRVPIYIGLSKDGIRTRVRRHLTSARSDVIANRQLDIWEISQVWAWPLKRDGNNIEVLESEIINHYNRISPLVNGKIPAELGPAEVVAAPAQKISIMDEQERLYRLDPLRRLPRQLEHFSNLFSHILEVKNNSEQRRMLRVHISRMRKYYENFMKDSGETELYIDNLLSK